MLIANIWKEQEIMLKQQANKTKQMNGFTNYIVKPKLNSIKLQEHKS